MNKLRTLLRLILHGPFNGSTPEGRSQARLRSIYLTAITAILAKVLAMAVPLITVRITLSYMGEEIYGDRKSVV